MPQRSVPLHVSFNHDYKRSLISETNKNILPSDIHYIVLKKKKEKGGDITHKNSQWKESNWAFSKNINIPDSPGKVPV